LTEKRKITDAIFDEALFPETMLLVSLISFIYIVCKNSDLSSGWEYYKPLLVFAAPSIAFALLVLWQILKPKFFIANFIITAVLIPFYLLITFLGLVFWTDNSFFRNQSTQNINRYSTVLRRTAHNEGIAIFPRKIPHDAYEINFSYGFSQDPYNTQHCYLSFKARSKTIAELEKQLQERTAGVKASVYVSPKKDEFDGIFDYDPYFYFGLKPQEAYKNDETVFYLFGKTRDEVLKEKEWQWGAAVVHAENRIVYSFFWAYEEEQEFINNFFAAQEAING
jgi:hypothetical protein